MGRTIRLLLVGDTSSPEALGSKFVRNFREAGFKDRREIVTRYTSPAVYFSPSMKSIWGKIFYRLADRRSVEWWKFQTELREVLKEMQPSVVLVTGILPLSNGVFEEVERYGGKIVNYLTDDPWNKIHRRRCFLRNIGKYDHIFSTKRDLCAKLIMNGANGSSFLPFAYDPYIHYEPDGKADQGPDVVFIGTGAKERLFWLNAVESFGRIEKKIYGNSWEGVPVSSWEKRESVIGHEYCKKVFEAKVILGILRKSNGDLSTDRSYEIGAIGGCGLYQDTDEHRRLLPSYPDEGFFGDPGELRNRLKALLEDEGLRWELRNAGKKDIRKEENTYGYRLKSIMEWAHSEQ